MLVASVHAAQEQLEFPIYPPQGLGTPRIYVSPVTGQPGLGALFFVFDAEKYGVVWVGESLPDIPDDAERLVSYTAVVEEHQRPDSRSTAEIVTVRQTDTALVGSSMDQPATIEWVDGGVQFAILGPNLTRDQVIELANAI